RTRAALPRGQGRQHERDKNKSAYNESAYNESSNNESPRNESANRERDVNQSDGNERNGDEGWPLRHPGGEGVHRVVRDLQHDRVVALNTSQHGIARTRAPRTAAVERGLLLLPLRERRECPDQVRLLVPVLSHERAARGDYPDAGRLQQRQALLAHEADELVGSTW